MGAYHLKIIVGLAAAVALLFFNLDAEAQCAMCKASIESSVKDGTASTGSGINAGILYIMPIPYLLIGAVVYFVYKHNKGLKAEEA